jgi:uncharacterized protein (TIGR03083 family)
VELGTAPVLDLRPSMTQDREELVRFLRSLGPAEWATPSAAPGWTVKDLALHLLDDDLGGLSRGRDGDATSLLDMSDRPAFVRALAAKNQRWVDGAAGLSTRVVADLLEWSGAQFDRYLADCDLRAPAHVSWAGDGPVPLWFDVARELTERWVHQRQMRDAVGRVEDHDRHLPLVLRTFVWAVPFQYRPAAEPAATVQLVLADVGTWHLTSDGRGRWSLDEGPAPDPVASITMPAETAWRVFTAAAFDDSTVVRAGDPALTEPLLAVRGIIV